MVGTVEACLEYVSTDITAIDAVSEVIWCLDKEVGGREVSVFMITVEGDGVGVISSLLISCEVV